MATQAQRPTVNGVSPRKPSAPRIPAKKPTTGATKTPTKTPTKNAAKPTAQKASPVANKAYSVAGESPASGGVGSAYAIMASRIANRVAEMAESITFVERPKPNEQPPQHPPEPEQKKAPRKLEMRFGSGNGQEHVQFSAPFLDNTLQKMLQLQNRMLTTTAELSRAGGVDEKVIKEHAAQSAELSRIIAMICAEKARQGA